jgi:hypothetical protein
MFRKKSAVFYIIGVQRYLGEKHAAGENVMRRIGCVMHDKNALNHMLRMWWVKNQQML